MNELLKKLKGVLEAEDLTKLEESITTMIDEKVELQVEEEKNKLEILSEEFCEKEVADRLEKKVEELTEEYDEKMETLEEKLVDKLDTFIDSEISESISDKAITTIAVNETYKPIIDGIVNLFEEKFVALDTEGHAILKESKEEIENLEDKLSESMAEKMELKESTELLKTKLLIASKVEELTESQKMRVVDFLGDKTFTEVEDKIDGFVELVSESDEEENDSDNKNINEDINDGENGIEENLNENSDSDSYASVNHLL